MHYLITGHTGFKGAWLSIWLESLGHQVSGISLDPITGSLFETARVNELLAKDIRLDIRNVAETIDAIQEVSPDVVFHMAAQPLVRESYKDPRGTFETNAMGTLNVLEGVSKTPTVKAHVVITTDKVYRNIGQQEGYVESDPLGGEDPYSASKAMADILTHSWIASFGGPPTAIARAGNVIGGGDISSDRLLPDLLRTFENNKTPELRYPKSIRPWQHVLDCLNGYLMISEALLEGHVIGEINIGPGKESFVTVSELTNQVAAQYGQSGNYESTKGVIPHEAATLALNTEKARFNLNWSDKLKFTDALSWTVNWQKQFSGGANARELTRNQIKQFLELPHLS
jgi:CDP-glucose 4,6-dehydratase